MKRNTQYVLTSFLALVCGKGLALLSGCSAVPQDEHVGHDESALTAAQCNYFEADGKVQICHRTGSTTHPYTIVKVSSQACINAHTQHAGDYVAVNDPTCQGGGCLPEGAPCDATLPCCDGFACQAGVCTAVVSDHCAPSPCQNGSACVNGAGGYTCQCLPGYTGTNCEIEIDECASQPCVNGDCLDEVNGYQCNCQPGWTGTNCDVAVDPCAPNPCPNGGTCTASGSGYTCACIPHTCEEYGLCDVSIDDGCGGVVQCPYCQSLQIGCDCGSYTIFDIVYGLCGSQADLDSACQGVNECNNPTATGFSCNYYDLGF